MNVIEKPQAAVLTQFGAKNRSLIPAKRREKASRGKSQAQKPRQMAFFKFIRPFRSS